MRTGFVFGAVGFFIAATAISDRHESVGDSIPGLTAAQKASFTDGRTEFITAEEVDEGLGPVFNEASCVACHSVPAAGGGSERLVTRFGKMTNGVFDPMEYAGGSLIQDHAIDGFQPELVPAEATMNVHRRTPPLFGLGLVDAVPDGTFFLIAAQEAQRSDGTAGRVAMVDDRVHGGKSVGKFGWKAQVPNLRQFSGDAYLNEMGITNPLFPDENAPNGNYDLLKNNPMPAMNDTGDGVDAFTNFMTLLGAPPRSRMRDGDSGENVFERIGCASCHVATLRTGSSDIAALSNKTFHPYSDFLLHDMGSLGDGIVQGNATGHEFRTAPLWGLRMITRLLHDGRATTIEGAILLHDGQGRSARDRFVALDAKDKQKLLAFLKSL